MKLRRFNEADSYDLSFDGFKEVMSEITDEINLNFNFEDNSLSDNKDDDKYYELTIYLPRSPYIETTNILSYGHLSSEQGGLAHPEDGGSTLSEERISGCVNNIDDVNSRLGEVKHHIDTQIENNNMIKNILSEVLKIKDRLSSFDNFKESRLGHDGDTIVITFEIK